MSFQFLSHRSQLAVAPRHLAAGIALVVIGYLAALIAPPSIDLSFGIGKAPEARRMADAASRTPLRFDALPARAEAFDYFPDHYRNQATESATAVDTF